jgi:hypothetical protein
MVSSSTVPHSVLARRSAQLGCPVFTFGVGSDHDASCLQKLALRGGAFTYISSNSTMQRAFTASLGALKGSAIRDCILEVGSDSEIVTVYSGYEVEKFPTGFRIKFAGELFTSSYSRSFNSRSQTATTVNGATLSLTLPTTKPGAERQLCLTAGAQRMEFTDWRPARFTLDNATGTSSSTVSGL